MLERISYCKIHPAIGVARVGNSSTEYFIGPERPNATEVPIGGYKDTGDPATGVPPRIKRQAARFRIYGYDEKNEVVAEITGEHAEISWMVHLVNSKAEGDRFAGTVGEDLPLGQRRPREFWRNRTIDDRASLIIDPQARTLRGPNQEAQFNGGKFRGMPVALGAIRTDASSRLMVLGGSGKSGSSNPAAKIGNYANNDLWHDDVSDGPVTATVTLKSGKQLSVEPSWVIVAPPDFAPAVQSIVTLYDVLVDVTQRNKLDGAPPIPSRPSFTNDIAPIFARLASLQWVQQGARGANGASDEFADLARLADNGDAKETVEYRQSIFSRFRNPHFAPDSAEAKRQATSEFLPALSGDAGDARNGVPTTWLSITRSQFDLLTKWRDGKFKNDWKGALATPAAEITPAGLDRAVLEACSGGAFYPGIEGGWLLRNPMAYKASFRLSHEKLKPGDVTRHMACPWQADFFECAWHWWPAQRPDEVLTQAALREIHHIDSSRQFLDPQSEKARSLASERDVLWTNRESWTRGLPPESFDGDVAMVSRWSQHGFVVAADGNGGSSVLAKGPVAAETERGKYEGLDWPDYFHILTNIEKHPDFLPKAKEIAKAFFAGANYRADDRYLPFTYTPAAFDERMQRIYDDLVAGMNEPSRMDTGLITYPVVVRREGDREITKDKTFDVKPFSNKAVVERLRQRAPFNLTDGAWLQRIQSAGPVDEITAHLFAIWDDEAGNGRADQNHCNVYDTLLRSQNIYMPPIKSREFVEQGLLSAAFIQPVFQFCVGLFPDEFLPELLGMTLYLEWEATPTMTPSVKLHKGRGIDPHFYALHLAIDNIAAGHGFLAKEAIKLYLKRTEQEGGSVQDAWRRVWNGYVTWATAGDLGQELLELTMILDHKQIDLSYPMMITPSSVMQPAALVKRLQAAAQEIPEADALSTFVISQFSAENQEKARGQHDQPDQALIGAIVDELNKIIQDDSSIYDESRFVGAELSDEVKELLKGDPEDEDLVRLNRLLLRDGFKGIIDGIPKLPPKLFPDYRAYFEGRFVELIKRKARAAKPLHRNILLSGKSLAELFETPSLIPRALRDGGYIDVQHPRASKFFDLLEFSGSMYKIFTEAEKSVILDWIESLRESEQPRPDPVVSPQEWAARVLKFISEKAAAAGHVQRHESFILNDENGQPRSLRSWFADPVGLMSAAVRNRWAVPGDSAGSRFYQEFATGVMSFMGTSVANMIREWIDSGAIVPARAAGAPAVLSAPESDETRGFAVAADLAGADMDEAPPPVLPAVRAIPVARAKATNFASKRKLIGMGAVH